MGIMASTRITPTPLHETIVRVATTWGWVARLQTTDAVVRVSTTTAMRVAVTPLSQAVVGVASVARPSSVVRVPATRGWLALVQATGAVMRATATTRIASPRRGGRATPIMRVPSVVRVTAAGVTSYDTNRAATPDDGIRTFDNQVLDRAEVNVGGLGVNTRRS